MTPGFLLSEYTTTFSTSSPSACRTMNFVDFTHSTSMLTSPENVKLSMYTERFKSYVRGRRDVGNLSCRQGWTSSSLWLKLASRDWLNLVADPFATRELLSPAHSSNRTPNNTATTVTTISVRMEMANPRTSLLCTVMCRSVVLGRTTTLSAHWSERPLPFLIEFSSIPICVKDKAFPAFLPEPYSVEYDA